MRIFFSTINRKDFKLVLEFSGNWAEKVIKPICDELKLVHCVDPFAERILEGDIRYFRLHGIEGYRHKYKGLDLKKLKDFCENESATIGNNPVYILFNNYSMYADAQRFDWIAWNTGRIKELDLSFLRSLCKEMEMDEEEERIQVLSREAERIVSLILHTDYAKVDIEIEEEKLRKLCNEMFPEKGYLYDIIYGNRFHRLWEQFREEEESTDV